MLPMKPPLSDEEKGPDTGRYALRAGWEGIEIEFDASFWDGYDDSTEFDARVDRFVNYIRNAVYFVASRSSQTH